MKAKIKVLSYYISMIILSLMTLALSLITIVNFTLMNENYILKQLEKNNYYEKLHKSIKQEMSYYIVQSGLSKEVLDNIYTKEMIKDEVNNLIINFYNNKELKINTEEVSNNLNKNIQAYLLKNNIVADDQEALNRFVDEMIKIYKNEIIITDHISSFQNTFIKLDDFINILFNALVIMIPVLGILLHLFYKRIIFTIPSISTSVLLFLGNYSFFNRVDVKNILFWNENISEIIKNILWSIKDLINKEAIILIICGIITFILGYILTNKNVKEEVNEEKKTKGVKKMNKEKITKKAKEIKETLKEQTAKLTDKLKNIKVKEKKVETPKPKDPNEIEELFGYTYGTSTTAHDFKSENKKKFKKKKRKR